MTLILWISLLFVCYVENVDSAQYEDESYRVNNIIEFGDCTWNGNECEATSMWNALIRNCQMLVNAGNETILEICADPKELNDDAKLRDELASFRPLFASSSLCLIDKESRKYTFPALCDFLCDATCTDETGKCDCNRIRVELRERANTPYVSYAEESKQEYLLLAIDGTGSWEKFESHNKEDPTHIRQKYQSKVGVKKANGKKWIWRSHVANFWGDYQGRAYYWYGPNSAVAAAYQCGRITKKAFNATCQFLEELIANKTIELDNNKIKGSYFIDIVGFSRGGYVAMEIARELQYKGCNLSENKMEIKPINVHWMGLYDPVRKVYDDFDDLYGGDHGTVHDVNKIGPYVQSVSIAERCRKIKSRSYPGFDHELDFKYASRNGCEKFENVDDTKCSKGKDEKCCKKHGEDAIVNDCNDDSHIDCECCQPYKDAEYCHLCGADSKKEFTDTSHSGVGGSPGEGDCKEDADDCPSLLDIDRLYCKHCDNSYTVDGDKEASCKVDKWMRHNAVLNNVPIKKTMREYYESHDSDKIFQAYQTK